MSVVTNAQAGAISNTRPYRPHPLPTSTSSRRCPLRNPNFRAGYQTATAPTGTAMTQANTRSANPTFGGGGG